jgi:hypothetical protein
MTVKDFKKGQTVCLRALPYSNAARAIPGDAPPQAYLFPAVVKCVGSHYITVYYYGDIKFAIDNNFCETTTGVKRGYAVYLTPQDALTAIFQEDSWKNIRRYIDSQYKVPSKCTKEDLQTVLELIRKWNS